MDQLSLTQCFDEDAQLLIKKSLDSAREQNNSEFTSLHVLDQILDDQEITSVIENLKDDNKESKEAMR